MQTLLGIAEEFLNCCLLYSYISLFFVWQARPTAYHVLCVLKANIAFYRKFTQILLKILKLFKNMAEVTDIFSRNKIRLLLNDSLHCFYFTRTETKVCHLTFWPTNGKPSQQ